MTRRAATFSILAAILGIAPACNNLSAPSAPVQVAAPMVPQPTASLAIEHTSLIVRQFPQLVGFQYEPRFQLRETGGKSGATIDNLFVGRIDGGGDDTGPGCWKIPLNVPPGGTLDTFYTDEGWQWLGYCGVWGGGQSPTGTVHVIVTFTDDNGVSGSVAADVSSGK